ncbi:PPOX class F420-dependent oxidoreductase [Jidongwangia harbinensis]|uniref:PPOX class F420-dependent oxidoreductase n=1 Tax=Jidongwangia harbinensis TaxID=2878561 RepID=UPI001CD9887B|nr:PPOX class F420-dependent oxidoreductase [Jidongwangia harbinensis]MCA2215069.1 PPOX class F420-dependent oxidoreductase [Jidongwangia harbinensis]
MTVPPEISRSKYVRLTTYRKDGTPVATPVWHVTDGRDLLIISELDTWKVKRIRNDSRVEVQVCNVRGRTAPDAPSARGTARLLDDAETRQVRRLVARKYLLSRVGNWLAKVVRLRRPETIGIAVSL